MIDLAMSCTQCELKYEGDKTTIVAGSREYVRMTFSFDADWEALDSVVATFRTRRGMPYSMAVEGGACEVPNEVIAAPGFTVGLMGIDADRVRIVSTVVDFAVEQGSTATGAGNVPTATIYERIIKANAAAVELIEHVGAIAGDADTALAKAQQATESANKAIADVKATDEAVKAAEGSRAQAETAREAAESERDEAEQARKSAETSREQAEAARKTAETARVNAEGARAAAEKVREADEAKREAAETKRASEFAAAQTARAQAFEAAENLRSQAETERVNAESARVAAERQRAQAETQRASAFTAAQDERSQAFDAAQSQRASDFSAAMGEWDAEVSTAVTKAEVAADNANAAAASANAHAGNYLRGEEEGALVHVEDAWPSPMRGLKVYGKSEQAKTTGKNLIPNTYGDSATVNGILVSYDKESQTFTINGTATASGGRTNYMFQAAKFTLEAGEYISSVTVLSGTGKVNAVLTNATTNASISNNVDDVTDVYVGLNVNEGVTYSNLKVRIQLEAGSAATDWEPYTGGKPSPSPDYPQEIKSIGAADVVTCGKNLNPYTDGTMLKVLYSGGVPLLSSSETILTLPYTITYESDGIGCYVKVKKGLTYTIHAVNKPSWSCSMGYALYADVESAKNKDNYIEYVEGATEMKTTTYTPSQDGVLVVVCAGTWSGGTTNVGTYPEDFRIQIEISDAATPYSPYTGSTTPVPLTAEDGTKYELRSLPDGTRDEVGIVDGRWVLRKRVGNVTLSGTEGWTKQLIDTNGQTVFYTPKHDIYRAITYRRIIVSDCFETGASAYYISERAFVSAYAHETAFPGQNWVYVFVPGITTTDALKSFIAEHTPTVCYKLATPQTIDLGTADMPLLPETVSNVWAASEPSTEVGVTYERDVTTVIGRLEAAVSTLATN